MALPDFLNFSYFFTSEMRKILKQISVGCNLRITGEHTCMMLILLLAVIEVVLACSGWHHTIPQTRWLKQQRFIFPQFWRQESPRSKSVSLRFLAHSLPGVERATFSHVLTRWWDSEQALWSLFL